MKAGGATGFDAYAHHPYYGSPAETPTTKPPPGKRGQPPTAVTLGQLRRSDRGARPALRQADALWVTEYGYQTNPPDKIFGVTLSKQAVYLTQAVAVARANPQIDMFLWFLLATRSGSRGWQSGLDDVRRQAQAELQRLPARAPPRSA